MTKHREAHRDKVLKPASIEFDGKTFNCIVRNISKAGALIETKSSLAAPAHLTLTLLLEDLRKPCRVIWQKENQIGVEFE